MLHKPTGMSHTSSRNVKSRLVTAFALLLFPAPWSLCHLPGTVACRRLWLLGAEEEPWQGGAACPWSLLRSLDPWPLHEARGGGHRLDTDVSPRMSRPGERVGRGVWKALHRVSEWLAKLDVIFWKRNVCFWGFSYQNLFVYSFLVIFLMGTITFWLDLLFFIGLIFVFNLHVWTTKYFWKILLKNP